MASPLLRGLALGLQLGLSFAVPLIVFALSGRWFDARFQSSPWLFLGGILLALILGFALAVQSVKNAVR